MMINYIMEIYVKPKLNILEKIYDTIDNVNVLDECKIFCFPMRTGKTYTSIKYVVPDLFNKKKCNWIILTAPLNLIIGENASLLKETATDEKFVFENDPYQVKKFLDKGRNVVSYWTNSTAFNSASSSKILQEIDVSKVGIIVDEADYGSVSGAKNMFDVKAYSSPDYKAVMYKFVSKIAKHSTHTYALTATPNFEIRQYISTVGDMDYKIYASMEEGDQKKYAPRVAWAGNVKFYAPSEQPLFGKLNETTETIKGMINTLVNIEMLTKFKRSGMIMIQDCDEELNDAEVIKRIRQKDISKPLNKVVKPTDYVGAVMTSDGTYLFSMVDEKKIKPKDVERLVIDGIDDPNNPLRLLLVKQMAGRGVTIKTVKELLFLRTSNPKSQLGYITESTEQAIGRAKSPYPGHVSISDLYEKYNEDIRNIPSQLFPNKLINTYNVYLPDNEKNHESWDKHLKFDACTFDMLDWDMQEVCPCCGQTLLNHGRYDDDSDFDGVDNQLT